jgi:chromosome segregation ATPase
MENQMPLVDDISKNPIIGYVDDRISIASRDIKEIKATIKQKAKELKERLGLNAKYADADEEYKSVSKMRKTVKDQVIHDDEAMQKLDMEVKSLKSQKKELDNALSDYLKEFNEKHKQLSFIDAEGNTIEFEMVAKIRSIE